MNFLSFLIFLTSGLLMCKFGFVLLEYGRTTPAPTCTCYCSDATMISPQLTSKVEYTGLRETTCDCQDFLVPKLKQYMSFSTPNVTCEICKCKGVVAPPRQCLDLNMALDLVVYCLIGVILLLCMMATVRYYCCSIEQKPSRTRYIQIGEHQIIKLTKDKKLWLLAREQRSFEKQLNAIKDGKKEENSEKQNKSMYNTFQV